VSDSTQNKIMNNFDTSNSNNYKYETKYL